MLNKYICLTLFTGLFFINIYSSEPEEQKNQGPQPEQRHTFYKQQNNYSTAEQFKKESIKQGLGILGAQVNDGINTFKKNKGWITPEEEANRRLLKQQEDINTKELELKIDQKEANIQNADLLKQQIIDQKLAKIMHEIELAQRLLSLDPTDKKNISNLKLLKIKAQKLLGEDLPDSLEEENKDDKDKPNDQDKTDNKSKNDGLIKSLMPYCALAATTSFDFLDSIADYSLKPITSLDILKDTFIGRHQVGINRTIIAVTLYAIMYKTYSWYKKYKHEKNMTEEDIFGDDIN